jgi:glutamine synthetase
MSDLDAILATIAQQQVRTVDFRFTDLAGRWRHRSVEATGLDPALLRDGLMIDGSSVPGWRDITESDLLLKPDLRASHLDPFAAQPTLAILCDGAEPGSGIGYERDPRSAAVRAEAWLARSRLADSVRIGVDLECYLLDELRVETGPRSIGYSLPPGTITGSRAGYLSMPPADATADMRAELSTVLQGLGLPRIRHGQGAGAGQIELGFGADSLVASADRVQLLRYAATQVAASYGKTAVFLPKLLDGFPTSSLRLHVSLWQAERNVFAGTGYADLSQLCLHFIAGIMAHAQAINAFANPTTNSYRRLRPGQDEPVLLAYAAHNRSAAIRVPYAASPAAKRIEVRFADPCANPYLAFAAVLMAGLDGIERRLEPGDPMDRNLYDIPARESEEIGRVASSLGQALDALEADLDFLTQGEIVSLDLIEAYVRLKRAEIDSIERTPHPMEVALWG